MDSTEAFIEECCNVDDTKYVKTSELFKAYDYWAKENNQYRMSNKKFRSEMEKKFNTKKSSYEYYQGIEVKSDSYPNSFQLNI